MLKYQTAAGGAKDLTEQNLVTMQEESGSVPERKATWVPEIPMSIIGLSNHHLFDYQIQ